MNNPSKPKTFTKRELLLGIVPTVVACSNLVSANPRTNPEPAPYDNSPTEADLEVVFTELNRYENKQLARTIALQKAYDNPREAMYWAFKIENEPYYWDVVEHAARRAADVDPWACMEYSNLYIGKQPWDKEVFLKAADKDPEIALLTFYQYKSERWRRDVILIIRRKLKMTEAKKPKPEPKKRRRRAKQKAHSRAR